MTAPTSWTEDDLTAFTRLHGLADLTPKQTTRMLGLARKAAETGAAISRPASKSIEPAGVFRVRDLV